MPLTINQIDDNTSQYCINGICVPVHHNDALVQIAGDQITIKIPEDHASKLAAALQDENNDKVID